MTRAAPPGRDGARGGTSAALGIAGGATLLVALDVVPLALAGSLGPGRQSELAVAAAATWLAAAPAVGLGESVRRRARAALAAPPGDGAVSPEQAVAAGLVLAAALGLPWGYAVHNAAEFVVPVIGPWPASGDAAVDAAAVRALGLPLLAALLCLKGYFDGVSRPRYAVAALTTGLGCAAAFAYALAYGAASAPRLGAPGIAAGTVLGHGLAAVVVGSLALASRELRRDRRLLRLGGGEERALRPLLRGSVAPALGAGVAAAAALAFCRWAALRGVPGLPVLCAGGAAALALAPATGLWRGRPGAVRGVRRVAWGWCAAWGVLLLFLPGTVLGWWSPEAALPRGGLGEARGVGGALVALAAWRLASSARGGAAPGGPGVSPGAAAASATAGSGSAPTAPR